MSKKAARPSPEAIARANKLCEIQNSIFNIANEKVENVTKKILAFDEIKTEKGIHIIVSMIFSAYRLRIHIHNELVELEKQLIKAHNNFKKVFLDIGMCYDSVYVTFATNRGNILLIAHSLNEGVFTADDLLPYLQRYTKLPEESYPHVALIYYLFAPEIHKSKELVDYYKGILEFVHEHELYWFHFQKVYEQQALLESNDFKLIKEYRGQGFMNNSVESILRLDSVEALKGYIEGSEEDGIDCSIYQSMPLSESKPTPLMLSIFYGSMNCFNYLMTKCDPKKTSIDGYTTTQFAAAAGQLEILKILEGKGVDIKGCLQVAILYHQNEIVDYLLNENKATLLDSHPKLQTPFACTMQSDNLQTLKIFLEKGFDANTKDKSMQTPLFIAAGHGSIATLSVLLMFPNININLKDKNENTAFIFAALRGQVSSLCLLLDVDGVDVNGKDKRQQCAMHIAATNGDLEIINVLLNDKRTDPNIGNRLGDTPLLLALQNRQMQVVDALMNNSSVKVAAMNTLGVKPIHIAAEKNYIDIMEKLIARKVDVNTRTKKGKKAAIHSACEHGYIEILNMLLNCEKIDINIQNQEGWTPLHYAAEYDQREVVKILLDKGADYNIRNIGNETPLHFALQTKTGELANVFLALKDIDVNEKTVQDWTALHFAANKGFFDICAKLISMGVDINAQTKKGKTPLHFAAQTGRETIMRLLIDNGADPTAKDIEDRTPLHYAAENGHAECCAFLLKLKNVDVNAKAFENYTPLHFAARYNHVATVQLLLAQPNIEVNAENEDGQTPLQYAVLAHADDVIPILKLDKRVKQ